ncbi:MAG: hypothetical protein MJ062_03495 [Oscillospiraceae bacterium]|nr:hypothetical protein [Oscillospiraceae bacterium]
MPYTVRSSERTRSSGAEYETKALLYLMNLRSDSNDIHYFVVDFFNDLTGMDRFAENLWDMQSKGAKNNSPAAIGKEMVTLFKNYLSDFEFKDYILFLGGVSTTVRKDNSKDIFDISNIQDSALIKVKEGLKKEALDKTYINDFDVTDENIDEFLKKVLFVVDDKPSSEYVKAIIKDHPAIIPEEKILNAIFNEIRNAQSELKNTVVEGVVIQTTDEVLKYCRHLTNNEIRLMTLNRIINRNPVEKSSVPPSFIPIYSTWVPEKQREMLDECIQTLCKALFNKNAAAEFWGLFENIYSLIVSNPTYTVQQIYQSLDVEKRNASPDFDAISLKYFISVVKDGVQNDN